jgi:hypothetical protein
LPGSLYFQALQPCLHDFTYSLNLLTRHPARILRVQIPFTDKKEHKTIERSHKRFGFIMRFNSNQPLYCYNFFRLIVSPENKKRIIFCFRQNEVEIAPLDAFPATLPATLKGRRGRIASTLFPADIIFITSTDDMGSRSYCKNTWWLNFIRVAL